MKQQLYAYLRISTMLICILLLGTHADAQKPEWSKPYQPFRIVGNVYYVGTYDLACYLITTPQGHILINAGIKSTVPMIRTNVEKLGFKFTDIRILLSSQAHFDHVGGMAEIQKITGAQVMINDKDADVMEDGGNSDYIFGGKGKGSMFDPVAVDRRLQNYDLITLGGTNITVLHHPGHTKGSTSYLLTVKDTHRSYRVLIANMPTILDEVDLAGMATYPTVSQDFAYTLASLKSLKFDVWLCAHGSQFDLHKHRKPGYHPEAFTDHRSYNAEIADLYEAYVEKLAKKK